MGGVDLSNQLMNNYKIYRKTNRWVNKLTSFVFMTISNNAYITFKTYKKSSRPKLDFRKKLFDLLLKKYSHALKKNEKIKILKKHLPNKSSIRKRCQNHEIHLNRQKANLTYIFCEDCNIFLCFPNCFRDFHSNDNLYLDVDSSEDE